MSFDVDTAFARLGITDPTDEQTAAVEGALAASLLVVENYLDRKLMKASDTDRTLFPRARSYQVKRFPVESFTSVNLGLYTQNPDQYAVDLERGVISFGGGGFGQWGAWSDSGAGYGYGSELLIEYVGGYEVLPADLELVLWAVFDRTYPMYLPPAQGGGGTSSDPGPIKAVSIPDVGRIEYAVSASSAAAAGSNPSDIFGLLYGPYFYAVLQPYMRMRA